MTRTNVRWRMRKVRSGGAAGTLGRSVRRGFTLIEVVVAMSILIISALTLMVAFSGYYTRIQQLRISTIGDNLAQLQMEDVLSKSKSQLQRLCLSGSNANPQAAQADVADLNYFNEPDWSLGSWANQQPPVVFDHSTDDHVYDSGDSGTAKVHDEELPVEGTFYIRHVSNIDGHTPSSATDYPSGLVLPEGVVSIETASETSGGYSYNVVLHKSVFPGYKKRIRIEDVTVTLRGATEAAKIPVDSHLFRIDVTVYWTYGGKTTSRSLTTEK